MEFTAREWRQIWEYLYNHNELNLAGRISHDLGHLWNSDNWDACVSLDMDSNDKGRVSNAAGEMGLDHGW